MDHKERQLHDVLTATAKVTGLDAPAIDRIIDSASIAHFHPGDTIERAYKNADLAKVVLYGVVKIVFQGQRAAPMIVRFVKNGTSLSSIHEPGKRNAFSAVAHTDAGIAFVAHDTIRRVVAELRPDDNIQFNRHSWELLSGLVHDKCELLTRTVSERILHSMRQLAADFGRQHSGGTLIDLPMTQQDLAQLAVVDRSTLNRAIRDLQKRGNIKKSSGRYILCDKPR